MLVAENVGKKYDRRWIFRKVSFELVQGDSLAILGRNGAGKSTLLRILAGLVSPSEGRVQGPSPIHLNVGYFALDGRVYANLTVAEHLELSGQLRGIDPQTSHWLRRIGLEAAAGRFGAELSTGMRSRLKLALAFHHAPQVLLLDEPGAGLDEEGQALIESICTEQREKGVLVLATNEASERRFASLELHIPDEVRAQ